MPLCCDLSDVWVHSNFQSLLLMADGYDSPERHAALPRVNIPLVRFFGLLS
jgi:hypothetical protein